MLFLTTAFTGDEFVHAVRKKPTSTKASARAIQRFFANQPVKEVQIPQVGVDYNNEMNGVDQGDQLRSNLGFDHRICKGGWQAIAWTFLLDVALINTYLLQLRGQPDWKPITSQRAWRQLILEALIAEFSTKVPSRKSFRTGDESTPIIQHKRVQRGKRAGCVACKGKRLGERQSKRRPLGEAGSNRLNRRPPMTRLGCDLCDVAICSSKYCWDFYHRQI